MIPKRINFTLVRHGETVTNLAGVMQGQSDGLLNDLGRQQASAAADFLRDTHFDACYSSDLQRAAETARIILANGHPELELRLEPSLREWYMGKLEGMRLDVLLRDYTELMRSFRYESGRVVAVPGGEDSACFQERIRQGLLNIAARHHTGENLLVVAHGAVLNMVLRIVVGSIAVGNRIPMMANAAISTIAYYPDEAAWELLSWNQTDHLKELAAHETLVY